MPNTNSKCGAKKYFHWKYLMPLASPKFSFRKQFVAVIVWLSSLEAQRNINWSDVIYALTNTRALSLGVFLKWVSNSESVWCFTQQMSCLLSIITIYIKICTIWSRLSVKVFLVQFGWRNDFQRSYWNMREKSSLFIWIECSLNRIIHGEK